MRRLVSLLAAALAPPALVLGLPTLLVVLPACDELTQALGGGGGAAGASASATTTATATATACKGFRDISGLCLDVSCLDEAPCDSSAETPCLYGVGEPACFNGTCAYLASAQGCGSAADCPCGLCGTDGRCYHDSSGGCGRCSAATLINGGAPATNPRDSVACKGCLQACAGTGPTCCAGSGCQCENLCNGFMLIASPRAPGPGFRVPGVPGSGFRSPGSGLRPFRVPYTYTYTYTCTSSVDGSSGQASS